MPGPLLIPAIAAGAQLASSAINAGSTANINKKTRKWNEKMYAKQRQDSLADYQMQNEYNHPSSVMQRLRDANLNPNLVYGEGANMPSATVKSADTGNWSPSVPNLDLGGAVNTGISTYYDTQLKKQTIDNLRVDNTLKKQESDIKQIAMLMGMLGVEEKGFDLGVKKELRNTTVETVKWKMQEILTEISKKEAETTSIKDENDRRNEMQADTLLTTAANRMETAARTAKTEAERQEINQKIQILKSETTIKQYDALLTKYGIRPGDKIGWRIAVKILSELGISL